MNIVVKHNGIDISRYVIDYKREQKVCSGIGSFVLTLEKGYPTTIDTFDPFILYEEGRQVSIYYATTIVNSQKSGNIVVTCQDNSKRLADYFIGDSYEITTYSLTGEWIVKFLTEMGISTNISSNDGDAISNYTTLGMTNAYDQIVTLLQMSGWYMHFENNTCVIGSMAGDSSKIVGTINDTDILNIKLLKHDKMFRNRALVVGAVDPNTFNYIVSDKSFLTPYNYDSNDLRAAVVMNGAISTKKDANRIANQMLDAFGDITQEKQIEVHGARNFKLGDYLAVENRGVWTGVGLITTIGSTMGPTGLTTQIILDERCPRLFTCFNPVLPSGMGGGYVYMSTVSGGVYRKPIDYLDGDQIWTPYSTGLPSGITIMDLYKNNGILSAVDASGVAYSRYEWGAAWQPITFTNLQYTTSGVAGNGYIPFTGMATAKAVIQDRVNNNLRIAVDNRPGGQSWSYDHWGSGLGFNVNAPGNKAWIVDAAPGVGTAGTSYPINISGVVNAMVLDIENDGVNDYVSVLAQKEGVPFTPSGWELGTSHIDSSLNLPHRVASKEPLLALSEGIDVYLDTEMASTLIPYGDIASYVSELDSIGRLFAYVPKETNPGTIRILRAFFNEFNEYRHDATTYTFPAASGYTPIYVNAIEREKFEVLLRKKSLVIASGYVDFKKVTLDLNGVHAGGAANYTENYNTTLTYDSSYPGVGYADIVFDDNLYIEEVYYGDLSASLLCKYKKLTMSTGSISLMDTVQFSAESGVTYPIVFPKDNVETKTGLFSVGGQLKCGLAVFKIEPLDANNRYVTGINIIGTLGSFQQSTFFPRTSVAFFGGDNGFTIGYLNNTGENPWFSNKANYSQYVGRCVIKMGTAYREFSQINDSITYTTRSETAPTPSPASFPWLETPKPVYGTISSSAGIGRVKINSSTFEENWFYDLATLAPIRKIAIAGYTVNTVYHAVDSVSGLYYIGVRNIANTLLRYIMGIDVDLNIRSRLIGNQATSYDGGGTATLSWFISRYTGSSTMVTSIANLHSLSLGLYPQAIILRRNGSVFEKVHESTAVDRLDISGKEPLATMGVGLSDAWIMPNNLSLPTLSGVIPILTNGLSTNYVRDYRVATIQSSGYEPLGRKLIYSTASGVMSRKIADIPGWNFLPSIPLHSDNYYHIEDPETVLLAGDFTQVETTNTKYPSQYIFAITISGVFYQADPYGNWSQRMVGLPASGLVATRIRVDDSI